MRAQPVEEGFTAARSKLAHASQLHAVHWCVIGLSLVLTLAAWYVTKHQVEEKIESRFERAAAQVVDLIAERMHRYEDALWGGVGTHAASSRGIGRDSWRAFAKTLRIEEKYPGINGIGMIQQITREQLPFYLSAQRLVRPDFEVYPEHREAVLLPITYIEPEEANRPAIGLDIAHETNRYAAAQQARDSGLAQITGPIVLVQDSEKTPGFLFYAPYYRPGPIATIEDRKHRFVGLVYAPFVVRKLMQGVLDKGNRSVAIDIRDGEQILYDELNAGNQDYDADPLFKRELSLDLFGRRWHFNIWSAKSFRAEANNNQPYLILFGGLFIDAMLLMLFLMLSRANRQALIYADQTTEELRRHSARLERSNADLEQFAYVASHDLQEPLRTVGSFSQLLRRHYADQGSEKSDRYFEFVHSGVQRMQLLLGDLLDYARVGTEAKALSTTSAAQACEDAMGNLRTVIDETGAVIDIQPLPQVTGDASQLTRLFQNLLGNALKFQAPERRPMITVSADSRERDWCFCVADNGIGIEQQYFDKIFIMFQRLHAREQYAGTGVGLAICKKIVIGHGGAIWAHSQPGRGAQFFFTIPKSQASSRTAPDAAKDSGPHLRQQAA